MPMMLITTSSSISVKPAATATAIHERSFHENESGLSLILTRTGGFDKQVSECVSSRCQSEPRVIRS